MWGRRRGWRGLIGGKAQVVRQVLAGSQLRWRWGAREGFPDLHVQLTSELDLL